MLSHTSLKCSLEYSLSKLCFLDNLRAVKAIFNIFGFEVLEILFKTNCFSRVTADGVHEQSSASQNENI